jgi:hypothetical protein
MQTAAPHCEAGRRRPVTYLTKVLAQCLGAYFGVAIGGIRTKLLLVHPDTWSELVATFCREARALARTVGVVVATLGLALTAPDVEVAELVFLLAILCVAIGPHVAVGAGVVARFVVALVLLVIALLFQLFILARRHSVGRVLVGRVNLLAILGL